MTQLLNPLIQRFAERTSIPIMVRSVLEQCLHASYLDEWFEQASEGQHVECGEERTASPTKGRLYWVDRMTCLKKFT